MIATIVLAQVLFAWKPCVVTVYDHPEPSRWYFHGRKTASGSRFSNYEKTAAIRQRELPHLPFGTVVELRSRGRYTRVKITDTGRGPGNGTSLRWFDLSGNAMKELNGKWVATKFKAEYRVITHGTSRIPKGRR